MGSDAKRRATLNNSLEGNRNWIVGTNSADVDAAAKEVSAIQVAGIAGNASG